MGCPESGHGGGRLGCDHQTGARGRSAAALTQEFDLIKGRKAGLLIGV